MKISVALSAYKGEQFIAQQLETIRSQLGENDEIIVSDDCPAGKTAEVVARERALSKTLKMP